MTSRRSRRCPWAPRHRRHVPRDRADGSPAGRRPVARVLQRGRATSVRLPEDFVVAELADIASLEMRHPHDDAYVLIEDSVVDAEVDLEALAVELRESLTGSWTESRHDTPAVADLPAGRAVTTRIGGVQDNVRIEGIHGMIRGRSQMHQVIVWTTASQWPRYEGAARELFESLREN